MIKSFVSILLFVYMLLLSGCAPAELIVNDFPLRPHRADSLFRPDIYEQAVQNLTRTAKVPATVRYEPYLNRWFQLEEGLQYAEFDAPVSSNLGDNRIKVIKADPAYFNLKLLSISEQHHSLLSGPEWLKRYDLKAVINASMFKRNYRNSVSYMKNFKHLNNRKHKKKYNSYIAFNPAAKYEDKIAPFAVLDSDQDGFAREYPKYQTVVQNMRMINGARENLWTQSAKRWSISALAQDADGNILMLFSRSPFSIHDFNENILQLPLQVTTTSYLEGGPVCFIGLSTDALAFNETGSFESGLIENNSNRKFQKVPNVFGLVRIPGGGRKIALNSQKIN